MKLDLRSLVGVAGFAAVLAAVSSGSVACKSNHVDRDGFTERNLDYTSGATDKSGVGTTTVTGADLGSLPSDLAVERIVAARCAREAACNNVGADKHFIDHDACARTLHSRLTADLEPSQCPRGVDSAAVDACMESIRTESCNNPVDTISRLAACRTSDMCIKDPAKKR